MHARFGTLVLVGSLSFVGVAMGNTPIVSPDPEFTVIRDPTMSGGCIRITRLLDATVYDVAGRDVGHIKDIALDTNRGAATYVALSHGFGFFERKTLALPFAAIAFSAPAEMKVCVQAKGKTLDEAQGFDVAKAWPTEANQAFYATADPVLREALDRAQMNDEYDVALMAGAQLNPEHAALWTTRASLWLGREVRSANGDRIGQVEDVVIDQKTGKVCYVCIEEDAATNPDQRYVAVSLSRLHSTPDSDKLVLNVGTQDVKAMPGFDKRHWPTSEGAKEKEGME